MKKASVALCVAAVAALALAGSALGGTSEVTIKFKPVSETKLKYKGKVKADLRDCRAGRVVSFKVDGKRLAKTETASNGKFKVVGKRPESGTEIAFKVKPNGSECPKLAGTGIAP